MLEIKKIQNYINEKIFDFKITQDDKVLNISLGGNGDLSFSINRSDYEDIDHLDFDITKENEELYNLFDRLYKKIVNCDIYKIKKENAEYNNEEYREMMIFHYEQCNKELKESKKYLNLVQNGTISWKSDNQLYEEASILNIHKEGDKYRLEFILRNNKKTEYIEVEISNSGSKYYPFTLPFMELYNLLQNIEVYSHQKSIQKNNKK